MAFTAKQLQAQRKSLRAQRERDARRADRERLRQLRAHLSAARKVRTQRMREVRELCKRGRLRAREIAKAVRAKHRAEANAEIEKVRARSRAKCETNKDRARVRSSDSLKRAQHALQAEKQHQQTMRLYEKPAKALGPKRTRKGRATAIQESDSEVVNNIPQELIPVWRKVKSRIKGSPRRSRTEAFLEWASENAGDVLLVLDKQWQADVDAMAKEEARLRRETARPTTYKRASDAQLVKRYEAYRGAPDVPF